MRGDRLKTMAKFKDYYRMLNIEPFADVETVKSAYRKLARQFHPDLNPGNKQAEERFKEINEAYEVLHHVDKKKTYDDTLKIMRYRSAPEPPRTAAESAKSANRKPPPKRPKAKEPAPRPDPETKGDKADKSTSTPINELFETFLRKGFAGERESRGEDLSGETFRKEKPRRGENVTVETVITPLEAEQGVVKTVNVEHKEICRRCSGTGRVNSLVCTACNGDKILTRLKKIDVRIPGGVKDGSKVRVSGEGGRGQGGLENGDLFLQIRISVDESLRIEGLDVYCSLGVSVVDAVLGAEVDVPTLGGVIKMTIPPHTSSGRVLRLKELGAKNGQTRGDQFVTINIVVPEKLSQKERALYEELARIQREKK